MKQKTINKILIVALFVLLCITVYQVKRFNDYQNDFIDNARQQACLYDRRANHNEIGTDAEQFCTTYNAQWKAVEEE